MHWFDSVRERWRSIWQPDTAAESLAEPSTAVPQPAPPQSAEALPTEPVSLELLADRLLGDERIRGALTDDEFQPLLDWALDTLEQVSAREEAGTAEAATGSIRGILSVVNGAFADGAAADKSQLREGLSYLRDAIGPPLVPLERVEEARERVRAAINSLADRETAPNGPEIAETLARTLRSLSERGAETQA